MTDQELREKMTEAYFEAKLELGRSHIEALIVARTVGKILSTPPRPITSVTS